MKTYVRFIVDVDIHLP